MLTRSSKWFVVLALVAVTGGHWFLLQSAAWVGMAVTYSQSDSLTAALKKTFDGDHPCKLCKMVKAGKASEKKQNLQKLDAKIDFQLVTRVCWLFPPTPIRHFTPQTEFANCRADAPIPPPPRTV